MVKVQHWKVSPTVWPSGKKLRLVVIADIHAGVPQMPLSRVEKIVATANSLGGDAVLLLGDFLADHPFQLRRYSMAHIAPILAMLHAPLGVFGVLGNHDWRADPVARRLKQGPIAAQTILETHGIQILSNRCVKIAHKGSSFWLAGLDSQSAFQEASPRRAGSGADDLQGTLAQVTDDAPVILMAHEPDIFPNLPDRVVLTLSGHTHGGQIRFGAWAPVVPSRYGTRYAYGHVQEGARDLIVSGGLGCSGLPIRFGIPPEITVVELG